MRINNGFELREMCGEHIIIGAGMENIDFSKVISLNESAAYLWSEVEGQDFTPETMAALLMEQYDVDEAPNSSNTIDTVVDVGIPRELKISSNTTSVTVTARNTHISCRK